MHHLNEKQITCMCLFMKNKCILENKNNQFLVGKRLVKDIYCNKRAIICLKCGGSFIMYDDSKICPGFFKFYSSRQRKDEETHTFRIRKINYDI